MYSHRQNSSSSLAIVSSVLFPHHSTVSMVKRRKVNLQSLPGAWIEDNNAEEDEQEEVKEVCNDKENQEVFVKTVSPTAPKLPLLTTISIQTSPTAREEDIEFLKQTIANLRKEKQKLEETNDIVKKSIQIVARKRLVAQTSSHYQRKKKSLKEEEAKGEEETSEVDDEDIYIVVPSDFMPTQDEMKAAGIDGWEWISAY